MNELNCCMVEGCDKPMYAKGYCNKHYNKFRLQDTSRKKCVVDGCNRIAKSALGHCGMHTHRLRRHGTIDAKNSTADMSDEKRLFHTACVEDSGYDTLCFKTNRGCDGSGYGVIRTVDGSNVKVHRLSYALVNDITHDEIPEGMCVCHKCDNPKCFRPSHLFLGTQSENIVDMVSKNRHAKGEQVPKGELCYNARLTEDDIRLIRRSDESNITLGLQYDVSPDHISSIKHKRKWKHVL